jgi:hypothetical protein
MVLGRRSDAKFWQLKPFEAGNEFERPRTNNQQSIKSFMTRAPVHLHSFCPPLLGFKHRLLKVLCVSTCYCRAVQSGAVSSSFGQVAPRSR